MKIAAPIQHPNKIMSIKKNTSRKKDIINMQSFTERKKKKRGNKSTFILTPKKSTTCHKVTILLHETVLAPPLDSFAIPP
jgi:hypothetical protein